MVAKDRETARFLSHEIAGGFIQKWYIAVGEDIRFSTNRLPSKGVIYSDMAKVSHFNFNLNRSIGMKV